MDEDHRESKFVEEIKREYQRSKAKEIREIGALIDDYAAGVTSEKIADVRNLHYGAAGVSFVTVVGFLQLPQLSAPLTWALTAFALAIPQSLLWAYFADVHLWLGRKGVVAYSKAIKHWGLLILAQASWICLAMGVACVFLHFSRVAAGVFVAASVVSVWLASRLQRQAFRRAVELEESSKPKVDKA